MDARTGIGSPQLCRYLLFCVNFIVTHGRLLSLGAIAHEKSIASQLLSHSSHTRHGLRDGDGANKSAVVPSSCEQRQKRCEHDYKHKWHTPIKFNQSKFNFLPNTFPICLSRRYRYWRARAPSTNIGAVVLTKFFQQTIAVNRVRVCARAARSTV